MPNTSIKLVNAAINTDPLLFHDAPTANKRESVIKLKERSDVKHIHISNSDTLLESYDFGEFLGKGSFGTVMSVLEKQTEKTWAMKVVSKVHSNPKFNTVKREIQILKMVSHPHIIFLHRVFESAKKIYLVLEKCTGELGKVFKDKRPFSEPETREVIRQLSGAVAYLHKNEIVHRDLKLENILLANNPENPTDDLYIKVSDFGLGIVKGTYTYLHDRCGTLTYVSPEVITKGSYSQQCDVWAMGVIMYLLLEGNFPFFSNDERELVDMICNIEPNYTDMTASSEAVHLVGRMLIKNPANRITAAEVGMHPWLLGKPLTDNTGNVLDMMKMWRSDLMVPVGSACDWALPTCNEPGKKTDLGVEKSSTASKSKRQTIHIPVQNIKFDKRPKPKYEDKDSLSVLAATKSGGGKSHSNSRHVGGLAAGKRPSLVPSKDDSSRATNNGKKS